MQKRQLPLTCPLCGRSSEHSIESLREGADLVCPLCGVKLNLHGHMWEEIQKDIARLNQSSNKS